MTLAFVDTGAWIALTVPRDTHHRRARDFFREIAPRTGLVTSNYVVAETVTWLAYHAMRRSSLELRRMLEAAESEGFLELVHATPEIDDLAWSYFERFDDQDLSFCDCASFAICALRSVDFVFGFDRQFRSAGFDLRP